VLDRHTALGGHVLGRGAGADPHLDLTRAESARPLGAQLLQLRTVPTDGSAQRLVDAQAELLAVLGHQHEVLPVVMQTHQLELTHSDLPDLGSEPATANGRTGGGGPVRRAAPAAIAVGQDG